MLERLFRLSENRTTVRQEIIAGITTFAAMAYILAVNPAILSQAGIDHGALITATALASALMTVLMALATNYPIALAPGMGLNAFVAFGICLGAKIPWQAALGIVFYSGAAFFLLTITGARQRLIEAIPHSLKIAISCGIGLFIAFIGLKGGGVIVKNDATLVGLANTHSAGVWLVLGGIVLTAVLVQRKVRGAVVIGILVLTVAGLFLPGETPGSHLTSRPTGIVSLPPSLTPTFFQLDLGYFWTHWRVCVPLMVALLFIDLLDNMGSLIGVCARAGFLDKDGHLPKMGRALTADATAAMVGATLGTSTVTTYIESAAGVEEGGRTGLTAVSTAVCFLLALFLSPLISIIPAVATAPALVIVGVFMMQGIRDLDLTDFTIAVPAVVTMLAMPLTFSIAEGIALGLIVHVGCMAAANRLKEVPPLGYVLAVLLTLHLWFR
jgi:AGZA family xanthine/uracil permease-like MFS transporter